MPKIVVRGFEPLTTGFKSFQAILNRGGLEVMKIDIYTHICPKPFIDYFSEHVMNWEKLVGVDKLAVSPPMWDIDMGSGLWIGMKVMYRY